MRQFVLTGKRTWSLLDEQGQSLGTLMRPKWYSNNAELVVPEGLLLVRSTKAWKRGISAFLGDVPLVEIQYPWRGGMHMVPVNSTVEELHAKRMGWFSEEWSVKDQRGIERARIEHRFNWKRFDRDPVLKMENSEPLSAMQLLLVVHGIFILQRRASAASA